MFQLEFDGALFTLKYRAPAFRVLFTLPPTSRARTPAPDHRHLRAQSEIFFKFVYLRMPLFSVGCRPRTPDPVPAYAGESEAPMFQLEYAGAESTPKDRAPARRAMSTLPPTSRARTPEA